MQNSAGTNFSAIYNSRDIHHRSRETLLTTDEKMAELRKPPGPLPLLRKKPTLPHIGEPQAPKTPKNEGEGMFDSTTPSLEAELEQLRLNPQLHTVNPDDLQDLGTIGDGNFSTVHKMQDKEGKVIAVKRVNLQSIKSSHDSGEDMKQIRELSVSLKLAAKKCPHIVDFFGYCLRDGDVWICMELMDFSLEAVKRQVYEHCKTSITEPILGKICYAVVSALHYLQKQLNVMHRDIKPSNVVMNWNGDIKLCDFGLTGQLINSIAKTKEIGCRPYMAPERIDPLKPSEGYTVRADVWSFGITMYELAVGEFPYSKWQTIFDQLNEVVNGKPPKLPAGGKFSREFAELVESCLMKKADDRPNYDTILEMPFMKKWEAAPVDVPAWLKTVMPRPPS